MDKIRQESLKGELILLRRYFHRYPELGFQEKNTKLIIEGYLLKFLSLENLRVFAETGVSAVLKGKEGKTILLRADMDALPIQEENDVPYRSKIDGVMHACGHDGHMAMLMVAAKILSRHREELKGNVKFVFQPSEEKLPGGAKIMIEQGVLGNPKPDMAFALHLSTDAPVGTIGLKSGPILAFCDGFEMTVIGKGGHVAFPHQAVDAIEICGHILDAWKTILTREISPMEPVVIQIGIFKGGTASNVIAEKVEIRGTVRASNSQLRGFIAERMKMMAVGIAKAMRAEAAFNYYEGYPALINDGTAIDFVSFVAGEIKNFKIVETKPEMGGEDFAYFLQQIPGCLAWLGAANNEKGLNAPHHSSRFNFDEDALLLGTEVLVKTVLEYLK